MTIAAFVIDTSASMSAKTASGCSLMDHAKNVVEQMTVKKRQTPAHYVLLTNCLLLTTEDWPSNVKTSWTDWGDKPEKRAARFQEQLKKLAPSGENPVAPALGKAFDLLGQHRLRTGVDTWGKGRSPWCTEPGAVILITDGKNAFDFLHVDDDADDEDDDDNGSGRGEATGGTEHNTRLSRKQQQPLDMSAVAVAASSAVGSELCGKPFRWDQRLFTLLIGAGDANDNPPDLSGPAAMALKAMCEETGGYLMTWDGRAVVPQQMQLKDHVGELMHRLQKQGPVVMFTPEGGDARGVDDFDHFDGFSHAPADLMAPPTARAGLVVRSSNGLWPIPEPFWVDRNLDDLPPRLEAQPEIIFRRTEAGSTDPAASTAEMLEHLGVTADHYELDWCGKGLDGRLEIPRSVTWPLFVKGSGQSAAPEPFGYLRSSQTPGKTVMVILPYNYPGLVPLLQQRANTVQATGNSAPPSQTSPFARDLAAYLKGVPSYYLPALQRVLQPFGAQALIPGESLQSGGGVFHRKVTERLDSLKDLAGRQVERADRIERARRAAPVDQQQRQQQQSLMQDVATEGGGGGPAAAAAGTKAFRIPVGELLAQWEGMRANLFGTGGATVKDLFGAAPARPHTRQRNTARGLGSKDISGRSWLQGEHADGEDADGCKVALRSPVLGSVAVSLAPALTTVEMSDFATRMQGVELPRDPLGEADADDNQSGFRRLMANTTFESPFAKKKLGFSPLGLDEAANESAILDVTADTAVEDKDAKQVDSNSVKGEVVTSSSPSKPPEITTAQGNNGTTQQETLAVASPDTSSVKHTSKVSNGGSSSSGGLRRQLPTLVAIRGRRKVRKDVISGPGAAGRGGVGGSRPNSASPQTGTSNSIGSGSSGSSSSGDDSSEGAARTSPLVNSGSSSGKAATEKSGGVLLPPNSPAIAAPHTPDHLPPPDSPLFPPASPMAPNDGPGSPGYRPSFTSGGVESREDRTTGSPGEGKASVVNTESINSALMMKPASEGRTVVDKGLGMGKGVMGEDPGSPERVEDDVILAGSGSFELPPVASSDQQVGGKSKNERGAIPEVSGSESSIRPGESNGKGSGRPSDGTSTPPHPRPPPARHPAARPPPPKHPQALHKARPGHPPSAAKPRPPSGPRPPPPRPSLPSAGSTSPHSAGVRAPSGSSMGGRGDGIELPRDVPDTLKSKPVEKSMASPLFTPAASPATRGASLPSSRGLPGDVSNTSGLKPAEKPLSSPVFAPTASPATATAAGGGASWSNPGASGSKPVATPAATPSAANIFTRTESPATLSFAKQSAFVRTDSPATVRPAVAPVSGRISSTEGSRMGVADGGGGAGGGPRGPGVDDGRAAKRAKQEQKEQEPRRVLTPHDYILPRGWIVAFSNKLKRDYYFDTVSKMSQWTPPEGSIPR